MENRVLRSFRDVPHTVQGHFRLNLYAAVYCLIDAIRRLGQVEGEHLARTFEPYPFLTGYYDEVRPYLPEELTWDGAMEWWETEITAWETACHEHLPLRALTEQHLLRFPDRLALMLVGLVEEDSRFGTVFATLQEPLTSRRPCLGLVEHILLNSGLVDHATPFSVCRSLLSAGFLEVANREAPQSEWMLLVPSLVWDIIRGETPSRLSSWCHYSSPAIFPSMTELCLPEEFRTRLMQVPALLMSGKAQALMLRGSQGSDRMQVLGAVAGALGKGVMTVNAAVCAVEHQWRLVGPLCTMTRSLPVIRYDLGPGETAEVPPLTGYTGPLGLLLGCEGGVSGQVIEQAVTLTLPALRKIDRLQCWHAAFAGHQVETLSEISERFLLPGGYIRQAASLAIAQAALAQRNSIHMCDVQEACRTLNRQLLDTLAVRLEAEGSWDRLVVNEATAWKLRELEQRCRHRERLLTHLGVGFAASGNRGVRALLSGASGTGKTLAAKILAAELGMDLYRVDLATVVNKYIGETEKNLHRILSRAEELDVILLLDEGDALLGNRTEVKSANDRYANLETNYLLQRLETYQGIIVMTTNAAQYIDSGFQRRMDVVVHFVPPQTQERLLIWQLHLPEHHAVDPAGLEEIARRCALTGGQIRNAALLATLLAVRDGRGMVTRWHLEEAIRSEYRKAGALCPLVDDILAEGNQGGIEAFLDTLRP